MSEIKSMIETLEKLMSGYSNDINVLVELNSSDDELVELVSNYLARIALENKRFIESLKGIE